MYGCLLLRLRTSVYFIYLSNSPPPEVPRINPVYNYCTVGIVGTVHELLYVSIISILVFNSKLFIIIDLFISPVHVNKNIKT